MGSIMQQIKTVLDKSGNIFIPAEYLRIIGLHPGDEALLIFEPKEIRITPSRQAVRYAQEIVRKYIPADSRLSEDLIWERRKESERE